MTAPADSRISNSMSDEEFMEACRKRAGLRDISASEAQMLLQAEQRLKAHIRAKATNGERLALEQLLIAAYLRGLEWGEENPIDREYRFKAAGDYADKTLTELRERRAKAVTAVGWERGKGGLNAHAMGVAADALKEFEGGIDVHSDTDARAALVIRAYIEAAVTPPAQAAGVTEKLAQELRNMSKPTDAPYDYHAAGQWLERNTLLILSALSAQDREEPNG